MSNTISILFYLIVFFVKYFNERIKIIDSKEETVICRVEFYLK